MICRTALRLRLPHQGRRSQATAFTQDRLTVSLRKRSAWLATHFRAITVGPGDLLHRTPCVGQNLGLPSPSFQRQCVFHNVGFRQRSEAIASPSGEDDGESLQSGDGDDAQLVPEPLSLSQQIENLTGCSHISIDFADASFALEQQQSFQLPKFMSELEHACVESRRSGLTALLLGLSKVPLPNVGTSKFKFSVHGHIPRQTDWAEQSPDTRWCIATEERTQTPIISRYFWRSMGRILTICRVRVLDGTSHSIELQVRILIKARLAEGYTSQSQPDSTGGSLDEGASHEVYLLDSFVAEVTRRVAAEMVFDKIAVIPAQLARAILAVSDAVMRFWEVERVRVATDSTALHQDLSHSADMRKEQLNKPDHAVDLRKASDEHGAPFPSAEHQHRTLPGSRDHPGYLRCEPILNLDAFTTKTGAQSFGYTIRYRTAPNVQSKKIDHSSVLQAISQAFQGSSLTGVSCVYTAATDVAAELSMKGQVELHALGPKSEWYLKHLVGHTNDLQKSLTWRIKAVSVAPSCRELEPSGVQETVGVQYHLPVIDAFTWRTKQATIMPGFHDLRITYFRRMLVKPKAPRNRSIDEEMHELFDYSMALLKPLSDTVYDTLTPMLRDFATALIKHCDTVPMLSELHRVRLSFGKRSSHRELRGVSVERWDAGGRPSVIPVPTQHHSFIGMGSNIGDRCAMIEAACTQLAQEDGITLHGTSRLYETQPMYVEDQDPFLNGACEVVTTLQPLELLDRLQAIEKRLGRVKTIDKGPRNIDLDILLYDDEIIESERLSVPHKLMAEREFVLRPLDDLQSMRRYVIPKTDRTVGQHLESLRSSPPQLSTYTPVAPGCPPIRFDPLRQTRIMSILNLTPDSFSDGGQHSPSDPENLRSTMLSHIAAGATLIDIGGQSSRPNAPDVTTEEEISRVLPAIEILKSLPEAAGVAISVDTYRAAVAEAAINAGAHIVNDISAGLLDDDMLRTVAKLGCTYVMMHMRGTPATMTSAENCSYPAGLLHTVAAELKARLYAAQAAGIPCWRIILDPGIGFAKTQEQNLELLRRLPDLRVQKDLRGLPWLVGTSRKSFIGNITGVKDARERTWGTAATVAAAVRGGADVIRVHDVAEMAQVAKMSDAIWRV